MTFGNYNLNHLWLQASKYQPQLRLLVILLLALYLLAYAADLTWRLMPEPAQGSVTRAGNTFSTPQAQRSNGADVSIIKRLNLFGDLTAAPVMEKVEDVQTTDAPETNLNLILSGLVASSTPELGTAVIANQGKQDTYGVGDKVEGTNATLREVYENYVIIRNGGRNETLMLEGVEYEDREAARQIAGNQIDEQPSNIAPLANTPIPNSPTAEITRKPRISQETVEQLKKLRGAGPQDFSDFINIAPHKVDNQLVGFRVRPGRNPKLFAEAGFKPGDIVVQINGLDLTDLQQRFEAMKALKAEQSLDLTISRQDTTLTLLLELPAGDSEI